MTMLAATVTNEVYEELLDELVLELSFEVHRAVRLGYLFIDENPSERSEDDAFMQSETSNNGDIFGTSLAPQKKQHNECTCPNCNRPLAAARFAPHLEKCMGMGRNSSRLASRRLANSNKEATALSAILSDDEHEDSDWLTGNDRKRKRKEKRVTKKVTKPNAKKFARPSSATLLPGEIPGDPLALSAPALSPSTAIDSVHFASSKSNSESLSSVTRFDNLNPDQCRSVLAQMCGVISEHTKRLCNRSVRCHQHTDDQRREIRLLLLGIENSVEQDPLECLEAADSDPRLLPDTPTEASPADSTSTSNSSTSSRKRDVNSNNSNSSQGSSGKITKKKGSKGGRQGGKGGGSKITPGQDGNHDVGRV